MKTETNIGSNYQLKGNPVVETSVPLVGNIIYDELGEAVLAQHNELFRGRNNIEDTTKYQSSQPLSFSNVPRIFSYNQILSKETNGRIQVLSPEQVIRYWNVLPERTSTYADTDSIVIFPKEGPNEDLRQLVLKLIGKQNTKVPLFVSNLGVKPADNGYGFTFIGTDEMNVTEAPFAVKNQKIAYNPQKGLIPSEEGVSIYTPLDQSGLRRAYRNRDDVLNLSFDRLLYSYADGRVQVVQGPQGPENLEALTAQLQQERERQQAEIATRYQQALKLLKTGKL